MAKAAGLEKSRFFSVFRTKSVANFSALSLALGCRSVAVFCQGGMDVLLFSG